MITGASGGLGRAVGRLLQEDGWSLALVGRDQSRLEGLIDEALLIEADVSTPEGAELAFDRCREEKGHPPTALAHCAGSVLILPLHRTTSEQYRNCLSANLDSAFFTLKSFVNSLMKAKKPGAAVLVSSVAARIGVTRHESIAAAKAGVEGLVRSTAASYSNRGIRVNAVAPGLMRSPATESFFVGGKAEKQIAAQYPLGNYGSVDDGAQAITWLLSNEARWVTGQILPVDGGFSAVRPMVRE
jgi:NAD(P)-dependent dehydrogenase (short-subunit alcohol dehydrogenase family)